MRRWTVSNEATTWAWRLAIPQGAKVVILALADHSDHTGFCWPGAAGLSAKCCISQRSVWRQVAYLEEQSYLCRIRNSSRYGRRNNSYQLHLGVECEYCGVTNLQRDTSDTANVTPVSGCLLNETSLEPSVNNNNVEAALESEVSPEQNPKTLLEVASKPIQEEETWPEWYILGSQIKGWRAKFRDAEAWRLRVGVSEELATSKVYALQSWWSEKQKKSGRNPYMTWQHWCRDENVKKDASRSQDAPSVDTLRRGWSRGKSWETTQ